jgi:hypothetical protein
MGAGTDSPADTPPSRAGGEGAINKPAPRPPRGPRASPAVRRTGMGVDSGCPFQKLNNRKSVTNCPRARTEPSREFSTCTRGLNWNASRRGREKGSCQDLGGTTLAMPAVASAPGATTVRM